MAEFVEQGAGIVIGQQRRLPLGGFGKVADVDHDRADITVEFVLAAHGRTPRARAFGPTGKVIAHKERNMFAVACHLKQTHIGVILRPFPLKGKIDKEGWVKQAKKLSK